MIGKVICIPNAIICKTWRKQRELIHIVYDCESSLYSSHVILGKPVAQQNRGKYTLRMIVNVVCITHTIICKLCRPPKLWEKHTAQNYESTSFTTYATCVIERAEKYKANTTSASISITFHSSNHVHDELKHHFVALGKITWKPKKNIQDDAVHSFNPLLPEEGRGREVEGLRIAFVTVHNCAKFY